MKALILIGGLGTRLRPLTCHTPKPLLPIVNRPFLEYQFQLLKRHGIKDIILCVSYLPHAFEEYCGNGKKWGVHITYVHEKEPLGTGGAIRNALPHIDGQLIILNGDILTDIDITSMIKYHRQKNAVVTIGLTRVKDPTIYGLVETDKDGLICRFLEKPTWDEVTCNTINAGVYIFEPHVLDLIPDGVNYSVERGLFPNLLRDQRIMAGYVSNSYWMDIGTSEKYMQAHTDMMNRSVDYDLPGRMKQDNLWVGKNLVWGKNIELSGRLICGDHVSIGDNVQISGNVSLGDNVVLSSGVVVADSVILGHTKIGENVKLEKALIGEHCIIESHSLVSPGVALGNKTVIRTYSRL